jgi:lysophospholipase L1-like esterase
VAATCPRVKGLILMTPYFIEPNLSDGMRARMDVYSNIVRNLSGRHQTVLVDTQAAFDRVLRSMHPMTLAWDRVHPNATGHMVISRAFLTAVGYRWD